MNNSVNSASKRNRSRQKKKNNDKFFVIAGSLLIVVLVVLILLVTRKNNGNSENQGSSAAETVFEETTVKSKAILDMSSLPGFGADAKIEVTGLNREEIFRKASELYSWNLRITNEKAEVGTTVKHKIDAEEAESVAEETGSEEQKEETDAGEAMFTEIEVVDTIPVPDLISPRILEAVEEIYRDDQLEEASLKNSDRSKEEADIPARLYLVTLSGLDEAVGEAVRTAEDMWYKEATGAGIGSYDAEKDEFIMEGAEDGCRIDADKLRTDVLSAIEKGNFDSSVEVTRIILPSESAQSDREYQIIGQYTTKTTNNSVRNKNVRLACEKLNGTILRSGEEFSYNYTIGERTAEKGYGAAAAYANGEVVQEIGGGVCQVSSTLYNAITAAGLKCTFRSPHTFKPTYVTPGQDATVSWGGPDFRFANIVAMPEISYENTYSIGIRAVYENQTVTVSIYGRPVLKPGYTVKMDSVMTGETEVVRVLIPEDDLEKEPTVGDKGSSWKTYLIVEKDGEQVSKEVYHATTYKGHTEYYREEVPSEEETSESGEDPSGLFTQEVGPGVPGSTGESETRQPETRQPETVSPTAESKAPETSASAENPQNTAPGSGPAPTGSAQREEISIGGPMGTGDTPGTAPGTSSGGASSPGGNSQVSPNAPGGGTDYSGGPGSR